MTATDVMLQRRAHAAVMAAVHRGILPKASTKLCVDCGGPAHEWDHHLGYEKEHYLDVEPRCRSCHKKRHVAVDGPPEFREKACAGCGEQFTPTVGVEKYCVTCKGIRYQQKLEKNRSPLVGRHDARHMNQARSTKDGVFHAIPLSFMTRSR